MLLYTTGESPVFLFSQALSAAFSKTRAPFTQSIIILSPCLNAPPIIFMESGFPFFADNPSERTCAVQRLITLICKISLCIFSKLKFHPLFFHTFFKGSGLDFHDFCKLSKRQRCKGYNFHLSLFINSGLNFDREKVYELHHASCCQKANYQEEYRFRDCLSLIITVFLSQ